MNDNNLTNEDRLLGMFSHLSVFFGAILLPIIFWAIKRGKSKFVEFHALQALFFHLTYAVIVLIFVFVMVFGGLSLGFIGASSHSFSHSGSSVVIILFMVAFYFLLFVIAFGVIGYSIYMGITSYHGECKKYPVIGNIVYRKIYGTA